VRAKPGRCAAHSAAAPAPALAADAVFRVRADCGRVARCDDGRALRDDAAADCHRAAGRCPLSVDCTAVAGRRHCPTHLRAEQLEDLNLIRSSSRPKTQGRFEERRKGKVRETAVQVMSYCRAHRESAPRRVEVSRDPLAPDTDRHHRRIRERVVDYRTDGYAGRDEMDVGVRSCSCGVAEKKSAATRMAHGDRGRNSREIRNLHSVWNGALQELRSCKNGTIYCRNCPATSKWYGAVGALSSVVTADSGLSVTFAFAIPKHGAVGFAA
jgi:hypothetical protein